MSTVQLARRAYRGRPRKFNSPDEMWKAALEYFEWVEANPLREQKLVTYKGDYEIAEVNKMRAMTLAGFCLHAGICKGTWQEYQKREEFLAVMQVIENYIREQKFTGAAADLLNARIISRDLGLIDKHEVKNEVKAHVAQVTEEMSTEQAQAIYDSLLRGDVE